MVWEPGNETAQPAHVPQILQELVSHLTPGPAWKRRHLWKSRSTTSAIMGCTHHSKASIFFCTRTWWSSDSSLTNRGQVSSNRTWTEINNA